MAENEYPLRSIGVVESSLKSLADCPKQGSEGAPDAWLVIDPAFAEATDGLLPGAQIWIITWLHQGQRDVSKVHPRGDPNRPLQGVFSTRSPDRPNPIGLHRAVGSYLIRQDRRYYRDGLGATVLFSAFARQIR
jgi:tRNA-Thr(GGU) m(6)t(6)A37 methyltransferase TsaA